MEDELECAGCMSDEVSRAECGQSCPIAEDHEHFHCEECGFGWTENA